ncbi:PREDICTED: tubulin monoglycylase TTLL3 [Ceratotherium simum simum]|uniref:Tubulin monoglycylase TTLL3 n=1 Tax=Ceratotherium simum simum TaxID=73337 RepID=A0ABM1DMP3_CERSS|nr:PREDICTED: tubulin monoglycylase TTLL3 [Ceratotherium simum simum]
MALGAPLRSPPPETLQQAGSSSARRDGSPASGKRQARSPHLCAAWAAPSSRSLRPPPPRAPRSPAPSGASTRRMSRPGTSRNVEEPRGLLRNVENVEKGRGPLWSVEERRGRSRNVAVCPLARGSGGSENEKTWGRGNGDGEKSDSIVLWRGFSKESENMSWLRNAKIRVEQAVKQKKIFMIQGHYPVIRSLLHQRGWVEKIHHLGTPLPPSRKDLGSSVVGNSDTTKDEDEDEDSALRLPQLFDFRDLLEFDDLDGTHALMLVVTVLSLGKSLMAVGQNKSRMVQAQIPYFIWTTRRRDVLDCDVLSEDQMINHYAGTEAFTTKVGLCLNLRNLPSFAEADADSFFPRCYCLEAKDDKKAFIEDFWLTAARNVLKLVVKSECKSYSIQAEEEEALEDKKPKKQARKLVLVSSQFVDEALCACEEHLSKLAHVDIDKSLEAPLYLSPEGWSFFLQHYYQVVHEGAELRHLNTQVQRCEDILRQLRDTVPQMGMEGDHNIWIVKPGAKSRGRGIMCMDHLEEILKLVDGDPSMMKDNKWVVQKYIERPLLIFGTKFDLRQWFLVTGWNPLTVWFYRDSYIRFSTRPFSLKNLDNSVHLCNNSIQKHLKNSCCRHPLLPSDNMWSSREFQAHLQEMGTLNAWSTVMVPGMKAAVIHALQTAQDTVQGRKANFELYGADFVFGEDFQPWLIEINSSPTMEPSTPVTAQLCASVQADTLRVVIDWRLNHNCDTGAFELIYKQPAVEVPRYVGTQLLVKGEAIRKPLAMCHRRIRVRPAPHLLTQQDSGEGKDLGTLTHRSAPREVAEARSFGHMEKPDSTATTSAPRRAPCHFPSLHTQAWLPSPNVLRAQRQDLRLQYSKPVGTRTLLTTGKASITLPTTKGRISLPRDPELKLASNILKPRKVGLKL